MSPWEIYFLRHLHAALWLAWLTYWLISARNAKRTVRRETWKQRMVYVLPGFVAGIIFTRPALMPVFYRHIWTPGFATYWIGTALLVAGLAFSIWARRTLGRNWSGTVTVKQDHELIQSGPYRFVRHPIYTGLLVALTGSLITLDLWIGVVALGALFFSFWIKLRREEKFMRETFGEKYEAYSARTKRLVPFVL